MKHQFKRALGLILALTLVMSFMPAPALAAMEQTDAVATSTDINIPDPSATEASPEESPLVPSTEQPSAPPDVPKESPQVPAAEQPPAAPEITPVHAELYKIVDKPLVTVVYKYYDDTQGQNVSDFANYAVSSIHSYYAIAMARGSNITIAANKFPGKVPVSTDALRFRVLLNGTEDITTLATYDAKMGLVSLPQAYMGHVITVEWYCPASEITELPIKVTICTGQNGKFTATTKDLLLSSSTNAISVPITTANNMVVTQNGLDLADGQFSVKNGTLTITASALGGDITVATYALSIAPAYISIMPADIGITPTGADLTEVYHTRSADQIYYGYFTSYYTANGNTAYCLDPTVGGVHDGTYPISRYLTPGTGNDLLIKCAYYLYGGPGYDSIKYSLFSDPDALVSYGLCHAACAYAYLNNNNAFFQLDQATIDIIMNALNIVGAQPMPPAGFQVFIYNEDAANQPMMGWTYAPTGSVQIVKSSSNPAMTNGNICYSLAGAVFTIYDSSGQFIGSITTDANGNGTLDGIAAGSGYYAVETTPPKGYAVAQASFSFTVVSGQTSIVQVSDVPQNDPIAILLQKQDADTSSSNPQGNAGLAGAEFTVKFYPGQYTSASQLSGLSPARTWVLKTDTNGAAFLLASYLVSGDPFYYAGNNDPTLPLGTVTVQETKAPVGYQLNSAVFIRQITSTGVAESVFTYNTPIIDDQVVRGGISIEKWVRP